MGIKTIGPFMVATWLLVCSCGKNPVSTPPMIEFSNPLGSEVDHVTMQIVDISAGAESVDVALPAPAKSKVTIPVVVLDSSTASNPLDYTLNSTQIVIPAGDSTGSVIVSLAAPAAYEKSKTIILSLGAPINAKLGANSVDTVVIVDGKDFGQKFRFSDNDVSGWQQSTAPNSYWVAVGDSLYANGSGGIDGEAGLYLGRGALVYMNQDIMGPNGPDAQICEVRAVDFNTNALADSMYNYQKINQQTTIAIPGFDSSVASAYGGIFGNITVYAHCNSFYFELLLSGYADVSSSSQMASQLFAVLKSKAQSSYGKMAAFGNHINKRTH